MTVQAVYNMAAAYLSPTTDESGNAVNYENYVPEILNGIAQEFSALADEYARQKGIAKGRYPILEVTALSDPFPLPERFAPAAACTLASLLCLSESEERSEALRERGNASLAAIRGELSGVIGEIAQHYGEL